MKLVFTFASGSSFSKLFFITLISLLIPFTASYAEDCTVTCSCEKNDTPTKAIFESCTQVPNSPICVGYATNKTIDQSAVTKNCQAYCGKRQWDIDSSSLTPSCLTPPSVNNPKVAKPAKP